MTEIAYQNKDITSKIFAESLKEKSLAVYGVNIPRIKEVWPTNLPRIAANELRMDNLFLLEDGTLALVDYESEYKPKDKLRYINYVNRVFQKYRKKYPNLKIRMIVLYTSDVEQGAVDTELDIGCLQIQIQAGYLSQIESERTYEEIAHKIRRQETLSEEDIMRLIILPLTVKGETGKQEMIKQVVALAKRLHNEQQQIMAVAGIVTFADKIISAEYSDQLKEWIRMTKVGRLFEEEKIEAVKKATEQVTEQLTRELAQKMKKNGASIELIVNTTGLDERVVREL